VPLPAILGHAANFVGVHTTNFLYTVHKVVYASHREAAKSSPYEICLYTCTRKRKEGQHIKL
jgi:hypothetical protein